MNDLELLDRTFRVMAMTPRWVRNRGYGPVEGLRPEHCHGERYASWADAAPVLGLLNGQMRGRWVAITCALCNGWHLRGEVLPATGDEVQA